MSSVLARVKLAVQQRRDNWVKQTSFVVALSFIYAICSQISIPLPFNLVPLSIQPLPVLLATWWFGRAALYAYGLYLFEGLCGLPVFAHGGFGLVHLMGPTGGYLIGFALASWVLLFLRVQTIYGRVLSYVFVTTLAFLCGLAQLALFVPAARLCAVGLFPFFIGDFVIKTFLFVVGSSGKSCEKN